MPICLLYDLNRAGVHLTLLEIAIGFRIENTSTRRGYERRESGIHLKFKFGPKN